MILILAATADVTARRVTRWLRHLGADALRIDCDDPIIDVTVALEGDREEATLRAQSGRVLRLSEVDALWYRRGELRPAPELIVPPGLGRARRREWSALHAWLMARLEARPSLGSWERETGCTKLEQLSAARALGLAIPATRIANDPRRLREAIARWPGAVRKGIQSGLPTPGGTTTTGLQAEALAADGPPPIFPLLLQERLTRAIELRIFVLGARTWTLAMVPRRGAEAPIDIRTAELDASFHLLPYALPPAVEAKLLRLMRQLKLDTGSIDMIVDDRGRHTFLEVNPSGQLDWLARALNAPIERCIAEHLVDLAASCPARKTAVEERDGGRSASPRPAERRPAPTHARCERGAQVRAEAPQRSETAPEHTDRPPDAHDHGWLDAPQRFTRACGQRVLVRPPTRPILRQITAPARTPSTTSTPSTTPTTPTTPTNTQGDEAIAATIADARPRSRDDLSARTPAPRAPQGPLDRRLPASLELVEGSRGALLCDLQRGKAYAVPRSLAPRLRAGLWPRPRSPGESRWLRAAEAELGLGLADRLAAPLPRRSLAWEHPSAILDAVIDVDRSSAHDFAAIFAALSEVGCEHALLRLQRPDALALFDGILPSLDDAPPLFLEVWLAGGAARVDELIARAARWSRVTAIVLFGQAEAYTWASPRSGIGTVLTQTEALDLSSTPAPGAGSMLLRDELFRLSRDHHPVFSRKLAIGADGELRNAPGLERSFGPLGARPVRELIASPEFRRLGMIPRERIAGCSECEFRRACADRREPHLGADGRYHHRSRCTLDPRHRRAATTGADAQAPLQRASSPS